MGVLLAPKAPNFFLKLSTIYFGIFKISEGAEPRADICRLFSAPGAESRAERKIASAPHPWALPYWTATFLSQQSPLLMVKV